MELITFLKLDYTYRCFSYINMRLYRSGNQYKQILKYNNYINTYREIKKNRKNSEFNL